MRGANPIREWVISLSYAVDKAGQSALLQSAKQTTQAVTQEATKQAEAVKKSEAERIAGAMRVNAVLNGAGYAAICCWLTRPRRARRCKAKENRPAGRRAAGVQAWG